MDDGENLLTSEKHGWGSDVMLPDLDATDENRHREVFITRKSGARPMLNLRNQKSRRAVR